MTTTIQTLEVHLAERSYPIVVGSGLLARAEEWVVPKLASPRVMIVTDDQVGSRYAKKLIHTLVPHGIRVDCITVPAGEGSKSFAALERLMDQLLALNPDRKTTLLALGGGVVGDLAGFAASILLRGVPFMQIPTTLLAQVDSSVGGKTGINTAQGKNLVGSFYQPKLVLADTDTLASLPAREMRAGYAEILKYGLIMDAPFYHWCLKHGAEVVAGAAESLQKAVLHACRCKADIVAQDEKEADRRALLNFGHTFAHALEAEAGYNGTLLHGEAVAIGMVMACRLSARMGLIAGDVEQELAAHLRAVGLPADLSSRFATAIPDASERRSQSARIPAQGRDDSTWNADAIAAHFVQDKKAEGGELTFVVLDHVGAARVAKQVDSSLARGVVDSFLNP